MAARRTVFQGVAVAATGHPRRVRCVIDKLAGVIAQIIREDRGDLLLGQPHSRAAALAPLIAPLLIVPGTMRNHIC